MVNAAVHSGPCVPEVMKLPILRLHHGRLAPFCDCKNVTVIFSRRHAVNFAELYSEHDIQTIHSEATQDRRQDHMSIFSKLFSSDEPEEPSGEQETIFLRGAATFSVEIVGEEHYQAAFEAICGPRVANGINRFVTAWLILDEKNRHDKTAVRVEVQRKLVGYLSHEMAVRYRRGLQRNGTPHAIGQCQAVVRGGWLSSDGRKGPFHLLLDIVGL